jgi:hypothetical protein
MSEMCYVSEFRLSAASCKLFQVYFVGVFTVLTGKRRKFLACLFLLTISFVFV